MRLTPLLAMLVSLAHAAPPTGTVLVPGGYRINTNSYEIPVGGSLARVGSELHIHASNGTVVHKATAGKALPPSRVKRAVTPLPTGIMPGTSMHGGKQRVPAYTLLVSRDGALDGADEILEAVLQYLDASNVFFTPLVRTSPGETLNASITLTDPSSSGPLLDYNVQFTNVAGTSLSISGIAPLTWSVPAALESYNTRPTPSDIPTGSTVFTNINLKLADGSIPEVGWVPTEYVEQNSTILINTNGANNGQITIVY
ncbi:hypothetical protein B0H13DRAFT_2353764 [Mycena leptocephala]|nr:hypothetical protein B0H13DRAFT_2353764 [Mycena leptocephala]